MKFLMGVCRWICYEAPVPLPKFGTRRRAAINWFISHCEHFAYTGSWRFPNPPIHHAKIDIRKSYY
jgi:hypothetical protein